MKSIERQFEFDHGPVKATEVLAAETEEDDDPFAVPEGSEWS